MHGGRMPPTAIQRHAAFVGLARLHARGALSLFGPRRDDAGAAFAGATGQDVCRRDRGAKLHVLRWQSGAGLSCGRAGADVHGRAVARLDGRAGG